MHRGDPGRTNRFQHQNTLNETLQVTWSHELTGRTVNRPPVPVFDEQRVFVAPEFGQAVALDRQSGTPIWTDSATSGHTTPIVGDDTVVFVTDDAVRGLDKTTGNERWVHNGDVRGDPVVYDDVVFAGTTGFDIDDGSVLLRLNTDSFVAPTVGGGRIYFGSGRIVRAADITTGTIIWQSKMLLEDEWIEDGVYVYADERLYVPGVDGLVALNAATGEELWRVAPSDWAIYRTPSVVNGTVIQPMSSRYGDMNRIVQIDASDGTELWEYRPPGRGQSPREELATTPGTVLVMYQNSLICLDVHSGEPVFATQLGTVFDHNASGYVTGPFAYDGRRLIVNGGSRISVLQPSRTRINRIDTAIAGGSLGVLAALGAYWRSDRA
ncbi:PQQ-binding-like beta-propeller repeat protein [Halorubrum sp. DTA98]|uniref:outer membrane protein assembly factor BamB family protein n=1 Tax=Halorubrum sp. DTA98 TaxID=3402163 RepID=UPI003AAEFA6A